MDEAATPAVGVRPLFLLTENQQAWFSAVIGGT
jgi:hypothetical protein